MTRRVSDWLTAGAEQLARAGLETPRAEARYLLEWATGLDRLRLLKLAELSSDAEARYHQGLGRRAAREPLAFITGRQGFWTLDLEVSPATLIPRSDSETLIEALLECRPERGKGGVSSVLDLGTGTGCLLLAALSEYPEAWGMGVDLSPEAAKLAQRNAKANGLGERTAFLAGSWNSALTGRFDVVLSNPPYIESAVVPGLMPEVAGFEPGRALDGGTDGLDAYRVICAALPGLLMPGGCAILELGIGQEDAVTALAQEAGLRKRTCRKDLGGIARALILEWES